MKKTETELFDPDLAGHAIFEHIFRLYVSGATEASTRAVVNTRELCERYLRGRYQLEILNISDHILQATEDQIFAAPTLVRVEPQPRRRFIGDMSDVSRIIVGLNLPTQPSSKSGD